MPRNSLPSLRAQIAKLEQKAAAIKRSVVSRLQREIKSHGLTVEDLFGAAAGGGSSVEVGNGLRAKSGRGTSKVPTAAKREEKYGDDAGNVWGGMGKRPQWLKDRLEGGSTLEEFLLAGKPAPSTRAKKTGAAKSSGVGSSKPAGLKRGPSKASAGAKPSAAKKVSPARKSKRVAQARTETTEG